MKFVFLLLTMIMPMVYAQVPVDYRQCTVNQKEVIKSIQEYHRQKSQELLKRAKAITEDDEESLERKKVLFRLAHESFVKNLALVKVSQALQESSLMVNSLSTFKSAYEDSIKAKLLFKSATESFKDWVGTYKLNSGSFLSLTTDLKNEVIERVLMSFTSDLLEQMTDDELFVLGISTKIGVKATMHIGGRLITARAIGAISGATLFEWAGGPVGVLMFVAPVFMSGTLPNETKWTDLIEEYPQLLLEPNQMIKAKLAKNSKEAMYLHCLTWQRRQKTMNFLHQKLLKKINSDIESTVSEVRKKYYSLELEKLERSAPQDNTYVKKPVLLKLRSP